MASQLEAAIASLGEKSAAKRRSAAKKLRKLGDSAAGPALMSALEAELGNDKTWEVKYHMIMALGECDYKPALPFLKSLTETLSGGMLHVALGDAIVRLSRSHPNDAAAALELLESGNLSLAQGAMQALAMLRMVPDDNSVRQIIELALKLDLDPNEWTIIWLLRALPGWPPELTDALVEKWATAPPQHQQVCSAVELARKRQYRKWSPL